MTTHTCDRICRQYPLHIENEEQFGSCLQFEVQMKYCHNMYEDTYESYEDSAYYEDTYEDYGKSIKGCIPKQD